MFERFSASYYLGRLYVEPHEGDRAVVHSDLHERVNEGLYATGKGVERLDLPLVVKLGQRHFPVGSDDGVPGGTLAVPEGFVDDLPEEREVLLADAERAFELLRYAGYAPANGGRAHA